MKLVKNFVFAAVFVSSLAFNTFAGDIDVPGYVPPPPPKATSTADEYTSITNIQPGGDTSDYLLFEALEALLSMY